LPQRTPVLLKKLLFFLKKFWREFLSSEESLPLSEEELKLSEVDLFFSRELTFF